MATMIIEPISPRLCRGFVEELGRIMKLLAVLSPAEPGAASEYDALRLLPRKIKTFRADAEKLFT
jgi:hypothetical protein